MSVDVRDEGALLVFVVWVLVVLRQDILSALGYVPSLLLIVVNLSLFVCFHNGCLQLVALVNVVLF